MLKIWKYKTCMDNGEVFEAGHSLWHDAWCRLKDNKLAIGSLIFLVLLFFFAVCGPLFVQYSYEQQNLALGASRPGWDHLCGTDTLGRDMLVRIMYGGRVSLAVGICATVVSLTIGVLYGAVSGYSGGKTDAAMMRVV